MEETKSQISPQQHPDSKNKILTWIVFGIVIVSVSVFYYYRTPTEEQGGFEFLSGVVVSKDVAGRTITVRANEEQPIPTGSQKTFMISESVFIQKIFTADPDSQNPEARFEDATFGDVQINDYVTIQGEFVSIASEKEEFVSAISIIEEQQ